MQQAQTLVDARIIIEWLLLETSKRSLSTPMCQRIDPVGALLNWKARVPHEECGILNSFSRTLHTLRQLTKPRNVSPCDFQYTKFIPFESILSVPIYSTLHNCLWLLIKLIVEIPWSFLLHNICYKDRERIKNIDHRFHVKSCERCQFPGSSP